LSDLSECLIDLKRLNVKVRLKFKTKLVAGAGFEPTTFGL
jgi:hypothetical protein